MKINFTEANDVIALFVWTNIFIGLLCFGIGIDHKYISMFLYANAGIGLAALLSLLYYKFKVLDK